LLIERHNLRSLGKLRLVEAQLLVDLLEIVQWIASIDAGRIDHMHQHARALDMTQEVVAEADSGMRAFDQPGDIGDDEGLVADLYDAKVRTQRGEGVVRDLWPGRADGRQQGRFSGVGEPEQADIGDQLELEIQLELLAGLAELRDARDLMG